MFLPQRLVNLWRIYTVADISHFGANDAYMCSVRAYLSHSFYFDHSQLVVYKIHSCYHHHITLWSFTLLFVSYEIYAFSINLFCLFLSLIAELYACLLFVCSLWPIHIWAVRKCKSNCMYNGPCQWKLMKSRTHRPAFNADLFFSYSETRQCRFKILVSHM